MAAAAGASHAAPSNRIHRGFPLQPFSFFTCARFRCILLCAAGGGGRGGVSGNKFRMALGLPVGAVMNCGDNTGEYIAPAATIVCWREAARRLGVGADRLAVNRLQQKWTDNDTTRLAARRATRDQPSTRGCINEQYTAASYARLLCAREDGRSATTNPSLIRIQRAKHSSRCFAVARQPHDPWQVRSLGVGATESGM